MSPRPARPWFRLYVEAMSDPKLRTLSPAQRWLWVALLGAARQSPDPGYLLVSEDVPHSCGSLADFAAVKEREAREGLDEFERRGMIEQDLERSCWLVTKFRERQYESDTSTERTRKHRSNDVPTNENGTPPETESDTETESPPEGPPQALNGTKPKKIATRIPDKFTVTPEMESWALSNAPDVDWVMETKQFVNHYKSKSGKGSMWLDWNRTWQNWILRAQSWTKNRGAARTHL